MRATLTINLAALTANYALLKARHAGNHIAAVVKANAYGLGVSIVSRALWQAGCRDFFVATLEEAVELRAIAPEARIAVFQGIFAGEEKAYAQHRLIPVLNEPAQLERVQSDFILHIDTGMTRLGFTESELKQLAPRILNTQSRILLMSHLACAGQPEHPKNAEQLARFQTALALLPGARSSLANSSGLFLPPAFHGDMGRPGCALYGINPIAGENPMQQVATLTAPILQIRTLDRDETIGYDASAERGKNTRIAITGLGYADGYSRSLSNQGFASLAGQRVPIVGRVSMDMIALDVSTIPDAQLTPDIRAEFIGTSQTVDELAAQCHTIGYEIFTRLGNRIQRVAVE